jgi:predicted PurR-regulated permease PerM
VTDRSVAVDPERVHLLAWIGLAAVGASILGYVVYSFVGTFVFGLFLYYATRPVYRRVASRIRQPSLAAGVSLFLLVLPVLLLLGFIVLLGIEEALRTIRRNQFQFLTVETQLYIYAQPYLELIRSPAEVLTSPDLLRTIQDLVERLRPYLAPILNALVHLFIVVAIAFYLLRDGGRLAAWARTRFADDGGVFEAFSTTVDRDLEQIFFGNVVNAVLTGLIGAAAYSALDAVAPAAVSVPVPILLGLLSGAASLVPLVGMKLVYVPATVYLLGRAVSADASGVLWFPLVFAAVAFVIVDVIPDIVLRPYVSGRNLHMGMVMFAYIFGPLLFGWYGLFLGPLLLVLVAAVSQELLPAIADRSRSGPGTTLGDFVGTADPREQDSAAGQVE